MATSHLTSQERLFSLSQILGSSKVDFRSRLSLSKMITKIKLVLNSMMTTIKLNKPSLLGLVLSLPLALPI